MSNLEEFFKNLSISRKDKDIAYVYYDQKGHIHKISNKETECPENTKMLIANAEDVRHMQTGVKRVEDFRVSYDPVIKQLRVIEVTYDKKILSVQNKLYRIPSNVENPDISVVFESNAWYVTYNEVNRKRDMKSREYVLDETSNFYFPFSITDNNDPNVLHEFFPVYYHDLLTDGTVRVESQLKNIKSIHDVSIYVQKYFETYNFEVIE